jgi:beta-lactamase regulating signal transducer with metallopeptidase domain
MIIGWMLYALLVGILVAIATRCLEEPLRAASLPLRWLWMAALLALVALTALAPFRAAAPEHAWIGPEVLAVAPAAEAAPADPVGGTAASLLERLRGSALAPVEHALASAGSFGPTASRLAGGLWFLLSLAVFVTFGLTALRWARLRGRWRRERMAGAEVRVSPDAGPAVVGVWRPEIVVPRWLTSAPQDEQRLVVLHEREHLRARDPMLLAAGCLAVALIPWHPAAWWMLLRLRLAVELDCDRRVLARGVRPLAYGTILIDVAGRGSGAPLGAPALADTPSTLERRLIAMTTSSTKLRRAGAALFAIPATALLFVACEAALPTSAEVDAMDVSALEAQAERLHFIARADGESVTYFLNGEEVSAEEARSILGDDIARVEVLRPGDHGTAQIRILTREGEGDGALRMRLQDGEGEEGARVRVLRLRDGDGATGELEDGARIEREVRIIRPGDGQAIVAHRDGEGVLSADRFEGIIEIDGERVDEAAFRRLRPEQIESVEVIRGPAAAQLYDDPSARQGVIRITTRSGDGQ